MAVEQYNPEQSRLICPAKLDLSVAIEGSLVGGSRPFGPTQEVLCDPDCTGPVEVPRAALSPLRIISAMKLVCDQSY